MCKVRSVHMIMVIDIVFIVNSYLYFSCEATFQFLLQGISKSFTYSQSDQICYSCRTFQPTQNGKSRCATVGTPFFCPSSPLCSELTSCLSCSLCTPLGFISVQIWCRVLFNCQPQVLFECANLINLFRSIVLLCALCIVCLVCGAELRLFLVYLTLFAWSGQTRVDQAAVEVRRREVTRQETRQLERL